VFDRSRFVSASGIEAQEVAVSLIYSHSSEVNDGR
jgi:hypothetical protein